MNQSDEDALVNRAIVGYEANGNRDAIRLAIRSAESIGHARGVKEERERAAKVCESEKTSPKWTFGPEGESYNKACDDCAAAIREG